MDTNRPFQFQERSQLFIRTHNKAVSVVAMRVHNPDRSPTRIQGRNAAPTPTGSAEIVSDYFPILHASSIVPLPLLGSAFPLSSNSFGAVSPVVERLVYTERERNIRTSVPSPFTCFFTGKTLGRAPKLIYIRFCDFPIGESTGSPVIPT
jgi:hypothetical protein